MRIALDAMGGNYAPRAMIEGALLYCRGGQCSAHLVLIGHETQLQEILSHGEGIYDVEIVHAPETIGMGEAGPIAIRKKRDASLSVAMRSLAEREVDAVVSAGNSGAIVATAKHFVGLVPGLRRPALLVPIPAPQGQVFLVDAGAHVEANAFQLAQWAVLVHIYLKVTGKAQQPRLGLLNIGQEPIKGTRVIQRAFSLLNRSPLNFVGNVEPRDLLTGKADAVVCDGFTGNIFLKLFESLSENLLAFWKGRIQEHAPSLDQELLEDFDHLQRTYYYQQVGGVPLLGIRKTVVVAHGCSDASAISNAIRVTSNLVEMEIFERMSDELTKDPTLKDLKHHHAQGMLGHWKSKWGSRQKKLRENSSG
jgi:glycerol-3-phosphate acyltransferase PlsX